MAQQYTGRGQPNWGTGYVFLFANHYGAIGYTTQGKWLYANHTAYTSYTYVYCTTHNVNDQIDYLIWLSKGTYNFQMVGAKDTTAGISTILVDGTSIGTLDWYNGSTTYNNIQTISSVAISTSAQHTVSIKMATTNPSSGDYYMYFNSICFLRTA